MIKPKFSAVKYLKEKKGQLRIEKCLVADGYFEQGLTCCLMVRRQPSGKFSSAFLVIDRKCLGVKRCDIKCNISDNELANIIRDFGKIITVDFVEVTPEYFHNLIYASIDYAQSLGFNPSSDFANAELLLDETFISDGIDEIEVGWEGKPLFMNGPFDNIKLILSTLNRIVGEGNYEYICEV